MFWQPMIQRQGSIKALEFVRYALFKAYFHNIWWDHKRGDAGRPMHRKAKIRVFKVNNFTLPLFFLPKLRSVAQNEWKKHPYIFFLLLVQK